MPCHTHATAPDLMHTLGTEENPGSTPWIGILDPPPAYEEGLEFVELNIYDNEWQFRYYTVCRGCIVQCGTVYTNHVESDIH